MLPLKDKTVLITRAANQVEDFINQLQGLGANTITLPLIENTAINKNELSNKLTANNYDWIIFTSTNAVKFFFETIPATTVSSKIAAVGEKTADVIKQLGLTIEFTPSEFTAQHLANEIPIEVNQQILIPRSNLAKNNIVEILEARNCVVEPISVYENSSIHYSKEEIDKVFNQKIDYITFTSGSTVQSFIELGIELSAEKVVCIGPETAKIAEQNNIKVSAVANPHTIEGLVNEITIITKNEE
ncbi:MAG: hypothetical protein COA77_11225 [Thaumarchaeota archaeon]|nr:MAG: hypothetical protein COA77_11225 [Nitrososphaerota archaeon]